MKTALLNAKMQNKNNKGKIKKISVVIKNLLTLICKFLTNKEKYYTTWKLRYKT